MSSDIPPNAPNRTTVGVVALLFGSLGIHKFMLGMTGPGVILLVLQLIGLVGCVTGMFCLFPFILCFASTVAWIIGVVEGIIYLTKTDEQFYQLYVVQKKQWF